MKRYLPYVLVAVLTACTTASPPPQGGGTRSQRDQVVQQPAGKLAVIKDRAEIALQGAIIGTALGAPGGIVGAGAGFVLVGGYSLITGDVPLGRDGIGPHERGDDPPEEVWEREIDAEIERQEEEKPPSR